MIAFPTCTRPTLGVELEVTLVDPHTGSLVAKAPELLERIGEPERYKPELFQTIIEINTDVCESVSQVRSDLEGRMRKLLSVCDDMGLGAMCTGTHPTGDWRNTPITQGERYLHLVNSMAWPARRLLICGLHVHVGMQSGEQAVALLNSFRVFLPHLLALSGSSPFWMGEDTGMASSRIKVFEGLPTAGLPPELRNWSEFVGLMRTLLASDTIRSIREVWWDVRPHPGFGTLEIRVCDGVNSLEEICALTAFIQCLAVYLQQLYAEGEPLPTLRTWTLRENKWRASRAGLDATLIRNERGVQVGLQEHIEEWLEKLSPVAQSLACTQELAAVRSIFVRRPGYERQRRVMAESGSHQSVVKSLVEEFKGSVR